MHGSCYWGGWRHWLSRDGLVLVESEIQMSLMIPCEICKNTCVDYGSSYISFCLACTRIIERHTIGKGDCFSNRTDLAHGYGWYRGCSTLNNYLEMAREEVMGTMKSTQQVGDRYMSSNNDF